MNHTKRKKNFLETSGKKVSLCYNGCSTIRIEKEEGDYGKNKAGEYKGWRCASV